MLSCFLITVVGKQKKCGCI